MIFYLLFLAIAILIVKHIYEIHNSEKIKTYRKQGEYGEKKFIKP